MYLNGFEWFIFGLCLVLILGLMNNVAVSQTLAKCIASKRAKTR